MSYAFNFIMSTIMQADPHPINFLDLDLPITNGIVSTKIYDNRDDFNFESLIFHFLVEMFLAPFHMVYRFRNLFVLQEYILMLMTSTIETKF